MYASHECMHFPMNLYYKIRNTLQILSGHRTSFNQLESPLDEELELDDEEVDESELLLSELLQLDLEAVLDFFARLDEPDLPFCSFFRFFMFSITSSFSASNFERAVSLCSRI